MFFPIHLLLSIVTTIDLVWVPIISHLDNWSSCLPPNALTVHLSHVARVIFLIYRSMLPSFWTNPCQSCCHVKTKLYIQHSRLFIPCLTFSLRSGHLAFPQTHTLCSSHTDLLSVLQTQPALSHPFTYLEHLFFPVPAWRMPIHLWNLAQKSSPPDLAQAKSVAPLSGPTATCTHFHYYTCLLTCLSPTSNGKLWEQDWFYLSLYFPCV